MQPHPQETADLVTFTEGILNRKFHFLCSDIYSWIVKHLNKLRPLQTSTMELYFKNGYQR